MAETSQAVLEALGPLAALYADPDVQVIMVDAPDRVLVERDGALTEAGVSFASSESIREIINALLALEERSAMSAETILPIRLGGGEARGVAILPPTAVEGPCLVIRKRLNTASISWDKLLEFGSITSEALEFLKRAVRVPVNILMAGGTASGKTTVANRIAELIPPEARLVIVESLREFQIRHPRAVTLEAGEQTGFSIDDLISTGAMMRPDWLIIGELRGAEAMRAVEILGRGYAGLTTIHASSLDDALTRLETMCLTANLGLGLIEIRSLIAAAFQLVCYQKRLPDGKRKIVEIAEVRGVENGQVVLDPLFRYEPQTGRLEASGIKASWDEPG